MPPLVDLKAFESTRKHFPQKIFSTQTPANFYIFSGFARATDNASGGFFGFRVTVNYKYGEFVELFPCVEGISATQFVSGLITVPAGYYIKSVKVECVYENSGVAYFDNISLVPLTEGNAAQYVYTEEGYTKAVISPEGDTYYEYNENGDVILEATEDGYVAKYEYNDNYSLKKTETGTIEYDGEFYFDSLFAENSTVDTESLFEAAKINLVTEYTYDTYGLVTMTRTYAPSDNLKLIRTSSTYDTTSGSKLFGKQLTYTDENGDTTRYSYLANGNLEYQLSPNGTGLYYIYDTFGRLTEVVPAAYSPSVNTYYGAYGEEDVKYLYNTLNQLSGITTATTEYSFIYDNFGNTTLISAGDHLLASYSYNSDNGKLASMRYGNDSFYLTYQYDALDRLEKVCYNGNVRYEYQYTSDGKLHGVIDHQSGVGYLYGYNVEGKLSEYVQYDLDDMTNTLSIFYTYNDQGQIEQVLSSLDYPRSDGSAESYYFTEYYAYDELDDMTHLLQNYSLSANASDILEIGFEYDGVQRLTKKTVAVDGTTDFTHEINYTYADWSSGKYLSSQIATYTTKVGNNAAKTYTYTYDANGNITKIVDNSGKITQYTYDNLGQLTREDNPYTNTSYVYAYDNNGNRLSKQTYAYTTGTLGTVKSTVSYAYGDESWGDLLTAYNGTAITYDNIGNPLSYYNGLAYTFNWSDGRRLTAATRGNYTFGFTYNDEGIRTSKTVNGVTHHYTLDGTRIVSEQWGNNLIVFLYDESGAPIGMMYRTDSMASDEFETYYFEKNLQGDIIAVYNSSGTVMIEYMYDAWGNAKYTYKNGADSTGARFNPFRYRGYYYDTDFGFYYLNSRYYDPITGRFISPDRTEVLGATPGQLTDKNLFAYCDNNPVMRVDHGGQFWETVFDVISLGASIIEVCVNPTDVWSWAGLVGDAIDLIPFVTGAGEITRAVKTTVKVVDEATDVVDAAHDLYKAADAADDIRKATGSYEILYKSGKNYIGKGGFKRAIDSAIRNADKYGDEVTSIMWKSAPNDRAAFIDEYLMQKRFGGVLSSNKDLPTYNRIWSPGRRYFGD